MANFAKRSWPTSLQDQIDERTKAATIDEHGTNIECEIATVSADLRLKIVENWLMTIDEHSTNIESEIATVSTNLRLKTVENWVRGAKISYMCSQFLLSCRQSIYRLNFNK